MIYCATPSCDFKLDKPSTASEIAYGCPKCGNKKFVSFKEVFQAPEPVIPKVVFVTPKPGSDVVFKRIEPEEVIFPRKKILKEVQDERTDFRSDKGSAE
jgi:predicted  nucleic acid-binding Zn-ribbon protein